MTTPQELASLKSHYASQSVGRMFWARDRLDHIQSYLASRLVSTLLVVALAGTLLYLFLAR